MVRLDTTMHIAAGEKPRTIARRYNLSDPDAKAALPLNPNPPKNPTSDFAGPNAIEAPFILKHDGWYFLFVSWDYCCQGSKSTYQVAVGRSKAVEGPYYDPQGIDMRYGGGKLFRISLSAMDTASPTKVHRFSSSVLSNGLLMAGRK